MTKPDNTGLGPGSTAEALTEYAVKRGLGAGDERKLARELGLSLPHARNILGLAEDECARNLKRSCSGQPVLFHCARKRAWDGHLSAGGHEVKPTGRTKKNPGNARGRMDALFCEYECSCGHVGWSAHVDLAHPAHTADSMRRKS